MNDDTKHIGLVPALRRQTKDGCCDEIRHAAADEIERLEASNEELIRGMTEMGQRYSAAMDGAGDQIKHLRATMGQIENILVRDSAAKDQAGNIDKRNFVGQAILLCRKSG